MSAIQIIVVLGALAATAWVNWYFFIAESGSRTASVGSGGTQEVTITVQGGYEPAAVRVRRGVPVRITFDRREDSGCTEEVVFPDFGVKRFLPAFARTTVELAPQQSGTFPFACGMGMLHGRLIVTEGEV
ncbi:MAG: cupredoxin domain-containing protein [Candidatus Krumholzibacteriia bacterium]